MVEVSWISQLALDAVMLVGLLWFYKKLQKQREKEQSYQEQIAKDFSVVMKQIKEVSLINGDEKHELGTKGKTDTQGTTGKTVGRGSSGSRSKGKKAGLYKNTQPVEAN